MSLSKLLATVGTVLVILGLILALTPATVEKWEPKSYLLASTTAASENMRQVRGGSTHLGASILLKRKIPSWEALGRVISIYRSVKSELLSKAREAHLAHFIDVVVSGITIPQLRRRQERLGTVLGELITAASFFESA